MEVSLDAQAGVFMDGPYSLVERHGAVDIGASLHVDPQPRAHVGSASREVVDEAEGSLGIDVEAQLRELQRDLRVQPALRDLAKQLLVMPGYLLGLVERRQVLAQEREHGTDPIGPVAFGGGQRIAHFFARHEAPDRATDEPPARYMLTEPGIAGRPEQDPAHRAE